MAASDVEHRVQKSPAAAQRPPHLRALEVLASILKHVVVLGRIFLLNFVAFSSARGCLFQKACQDGPLAFEGGRFRYHQPIVTEVQVIRLLFVWLS